MDNKSSPDPVLTQIKWPLRLTLLALWAEGLARAFWPLCALAFGVFAALAFGLPSLLSPSLLSLDLSWYAALAALGALAGALHYAWRHFQRPSIPAALARLDGQIAGQPLAALRDAQAIGADDPAAIAVWQTHRARMAQRLSSLRAVPPNVRLSAADPFALRYGALLLATLALLFGAPGQLGSLGAWGSADTAATGPMWEAWATPPSYTGKAALYLADQPQGPLTLPAGTRLDLRLYGAAGDVILAETISARTNPIEITKQTQSFTVAQSGVLQFKGQGGRDFDVVVLPDAPPTIAVNGAIGREGGARFTLPFRATDDYAITKGAAQIALDLDAVDRRYGLTAAPDTLPNVTLDLPLPRRGGRAGLDATLIDDLSKSLLANQPVIITLQAVDAAGNTAESAPFKAILPAKRFFDPLAAAIIESRRDVLWARANTPRAVQVLKAVTTAPEGFIRNQRAYLRLRAVIKALAAQQTNLPDTTRTELAEEMWQIAVLIEEGDLTSARERLTRAQDRLDEAIRKGAAPEEIAKLMEELQDALKDYTRQLAEEQRKSGTSSVQDQGQQGQSVTQDQLQQMLDRLQQLMEQGKTAEAAELMQRLREFMDNMQIAEGEGGQGQNGPSGQSMGQLRDTLRGQQDLSDDAFRDMQQGGDGTSQSDQGEGDLSQRQQDLRDQLGQLQDQGQLPGADSDAGDAGRTALDDAARAMEDAEEALRDGDLPRALDGQARALQALREGMSQFNQALAEENQQQGDGDRQYGRNQGQEDPRGTDPLGRPDGNGLRNGSDNNLLGNEDVYRRAEDLLEEIRRRSGEGARPEDERNYLKRLLDLF